MTTEIGPERFAGLKGAWKSVANFGVIGVMSGLVVYLVIFTLPKIQHEFHEALKLEREAARGEIREERAASRIEAERSREHGNQASREIGDAVRELSDTIIVIQSKTHENQERLIELQQESLKKRTGSE